METIGVELRVSYIDSYRVLVQTPGRSVREKVRSPIRIHIDGIYPDFPYRNTSTSQDFPSIPSYRRALFISANLRSLQVRFALQLVEIASICLGGYATPFQRQPVICFVVREYRE